MVYRNFRINVVIRLVLIVLLLGFFSFYLFVSSNYIRSIYLGIFILLLLIELFWYIDKRNRELTTFLKSLLNDDFSSRFKDAGKGKSFESFYKTMNSITEKFHNLSAEKEIQFQYMQALIQHVKVGIISFDSEGRIHIVNHAFRYFFNIPRIRKDSLIDDLNPDIIDLLCKIQSEEKKIIKVQQKGKNISLVINATEFKLEDKQYKLISAQNIREELEKQELEAWQKLIRILTHEIMNSVTPILSLSSSLYDLIETKNSKVKQFDEKLIQSLQSGLEAIVDRSTGLMRFTEAYKTLTRIPPPKIKSVRSDELAHRINTLFKTQTEEKNIGFSVELLSKPWSVQCDIELLDMVFINLIKNSIQALENKTNTQIKVRLRTTGKSKTIIEIEDNGKGMAQEVMNQIFVPFYTTKPDGSGIGLSVSNQIIRSHDGTIHVESEPGKGTVFFIRL